MPEPAPLHYVCAQPQYNDHAWRSVHLPHDWSNEDLPPRDEDREYPVVGVRYGPWKLKAGDNTTWSLAGFDDSAWPAAKGGVDWRTYGPAFNAVNATGWYRQNFSVPAFMVNSSVHVTLSLGIIAGADQTYLNGQLISTKAPTETLSTRDYITPRAYTIPQNLLIAGNSSTNNVAVRVYSYGGADPSPTKNGTKPDGGFAGGVYDNPVLKNHDVRSGPFDAAVSAGGKSTGYHVGGVGWYRKSFTQSFAPGQQVLIQFDGVYMDADFYLNGVHLGNHPYGYTTFQYDMTPHLKTHGTNVLAVRTASIGQNSRWYAGAGIYRHVWITVVDAVHIPLWGLGITTPKVDIVTPTEASSAVVALSIAVYNSMATSASVVANITVNGSGLVQHAISQPLTVAANATTTINVSVTLAHKVYLWSPDTPVLYDATVGVTSANPHGTKTWDAVTLAFGVRTLSFNASTGFRLNGVETKMRGGCVHHANGILGSAAIDRADERRVELLKRHGYNAIRTSHNPPSPAFLDACDRLGVLVMNEAFDCWAQGKLPNDYHLYFKKWWKRDLATMVLRDRHHPSIVMWSIGNEVGLCYSHYLQLPTQWILSFTHETSFFIMCHCLHTLSSTCRQTSSSFVFVGFVCD